MSARICVYACFSCMFYMSIVFPSFLSLLFLLGQNKGANLAVTKFWILNKILLLLLYYYYYYYMFVSTLVMNLINCGWVYLSACMHTCVYMHTYHTRKSAYTYTQLHMDAYIHIHISTHVRAQAHNHTYACLCTQARIYTYTQLNAHTQQASYWHIYRPTSLLVSYTRLRA